MQALKIVLVGLLSLSLVQAAKKLKYRTKSMKASQTDMDAMKPKIDKLRADLTLLQKCLNTSASDPNHAIYCVAPPESSFSGTGNQKPSGRKGFVELPEDRSTAATEADTFAIGDMYLTGYSTRCGPQTITSWTQDLDIYYSTTAVADSTTSYISTSGGTYTAPAAGYYNICASLRFLKGGNAVDVTVYAGGSVVAGFGDALDADWRSTGTCLIRLLAEGNTVYIRNNSGGGSDCVEETSWRYGRLAVYMVAPSA